MYFCPQLFRRIRRQVGAEQISPFARFAPVPPIFLDLPEQADAEFDHLIWPTLIA
jgi:hypothetical protein